MRPYSWICSSNSRAIPSRRICRVPLITLAPRSRTGICSILTRMMESRQRWNIVPNPPCKVRVGICCRVVRIRNRTIILWVSSHTSILAQLIKIASNLTKSPSRFTVTTLGITSHRRDQMRQPRLRRWLDPAGSKTSSTWDHPSTPTLAKSSRQDICRRILARVLEVCYKGTQTEGVWACYSKDIKISWNKQRHCHQVRISQAQRAK